MQAEEAEKLVRAYGGRCLALASHHDEVCKPTLYTSYWGTLLGDVGRASSAVGAQDR